MFFLRRPDREHVEGVLSEARTASPTFAPVGATASSDAVPGFHYASYGRVVGHGPADWEAARDGLWAWAAHVGAGVAITPPSEPLEVGATVVAATRVGPLYVLIPCRIVSTVDETDRFGFTYATLPGHPECGEESFILTRNAAGGVTFTVSAHSRHAELLAKLGAPVSRFVQRQTNNAYIAGLAAFVDRQRS
ncbi:MAG: DUF1990 domain-containing protein [Actinobacteria bacterium]|nr:DUF1990 domain-containing protein [Actinomycetota bacterium]